MLDLISIGTLSGHGVLAIVFTALVFLLFIVDRWRIQSVCLTVLVALPVLFWAFPYYDPSTTHEVSPFIFFAGFGHEALIAICSLMVLGRALVLTGALDRVARKISRLLERSPRFAFLVILIACGAASGLVNDTPLVVMMIPLLVAATAQSKFAPAQTLMPMNFAVLIGGMATTIGTSTNLIVVSTAASLGEPPLQMFDFYHLVAIAAIPALLYLWLFAPMLLKDVKGVGAQNPTALYSAQLHVKAGGPIDGRTLKEVFELTQWKMHVLEIRRGENLTLARLPATKLNAGDRLLVEDTAANLRAFSDLLGAELHGIGIDEGETVPSTPPVATAESKGEANDETERRVSESDRVLAEIILTNDSPLVGSTLRQTRFADAFGMIVVGVRRSRNSHEIRRNDISDLVLSAEDVLLVQGTEEQLQEVKNTNTGLVLDMRMPLPRADKAVITLVVMALVVLAAAFKFAPIALAALGGVLVLLGANCLKWRDVSTALSINVVLLVAASLALGQALTITGGTAFLAQQLAQLAHVVDARWFLALLMFSMGVLTNFVSNNAAAAIGTPLAVELARQLGIPAEPLILAVLFGCNLCYVTPMGYQTNLLVMNAAGYRFSDFVKVGAPLFVLLWATLSFLLIRQYGI